MASPAQRIRAMHLYRHTLKNVVSWCFRREIFWEEVSPRNHLHLVAAGHIKRLKGCV